jgi:molybdopterin synthase catalytic subunit
LKPSITIKMKTIYLTEGAISQELISGMIADMNKKTDSGGHMFFLGQVRADVIEGKRVSAIEYSAYPEMVQTEAEKIKTEILKEFPDVRSVDIIHSAGLVKTGEISLAVLVSAGHRQQAFEACSKTVELIKANLPVWKKEIFEDNSHIWI